MPLQETCQKCVDLWREYGAATREHVGLLREQEQSAGIEPEQFRALDSATELAAIRRDSARNAIKLHLKDDHGAKLTMTA